MAEHPKGLNAVALDPTFRVLAEILKKCDETGADKSFRNAVAFAIELGGERLNYCNKVSTEPSQALQTISSETISYPFDKAHDEGKTKRLLRPVMMSGGLEGKFLQSLVLMSKAKHVLEVGMFTGYAALACAEVLPDDGTVTSCEVDPFLKDMARNFFNNSTHGKKIDIRIGPASETLEELAKEKKLYDFVFIDANKEGYIDYYKTIIEKGLLAEGGVIAFDNTLSWGLPYSVDQMAQSGNHMVVNASGVDRRKMGDSIKALNDYMMTQNDMLRGRMPQLIWDITSNTVGIVHDGMDNEYGHICLASGQFSSYGIAFGYLKDYFRCWFQSEMVFYLLKENRKPCEISVTDVFIEGNKTKHSRIRTIDCVTVY